MKAQGYRFPQTDTEVSLCVIVLVTREEYPRLFPILRRVPKGRQRANRLRGLAALGEQCEGAILLGERSPVRAAPSPELDHPPKEASAVAAAQMFADPTAE